MLLNKLGQKSYLELSSNKLKKRWKKLEKMEKMEKKALLLIDARSLKTLPIPYPVGARDNEDPL